MTVREITPGESTVSCKRRFSVNRAWRIVAPLCLMPLLLRFDGYSYNHPELRWKSSASDHFVVHYYDNTAPFVSAALGTAENVYASLVALYGTSLRNKIDIVLADYDDISNGYADWLGGTVTIWVPEGKMPFRCNAPWLRNVITHELTHIFSLRKLPGTQVLAAQASVGVHRPGFDLTLGKTLPMMELFPMWFVEGVAQLGSARCGNDCWDSRRDMVLRCALLDRKDLSLEGMEVFAHDQLGNEQVYNQGFSFVKYIENAIGAGALHDLLRKAGNQSFDPFAGMQPGALSALKGRNLESCHRSWRDSALAAARRKLPVRVTSVECVWRKGRLNQVPRVHPRGLVWGCLTSNNDDSYRTDLVIVPRGGSEPVRVVRHALASWDFAPKTGFVYFIKSYDPGRHGSFFNELYRYNLSNKKTERLTRNGRVYAVAVSPTEKEVAVVRFRNARFSLETFDLSTAAFHVLNEGAPGDPFVALDYNPGDSSRLIAERIVNGRSSVYLVDRGSGDIRRLTGAAANEESPSWAPNGRIYFSADYDGIFNCYSIKPDGSDLVRHTSVAGGAFEPVLETGGATLLFSEYTSSGFRISRAAPDSTPYSISETAGCVFSPRAVYPQTLPGRPYSMRMSRATWQSLFTADFYSTDSVSEFLTDIGCVRFQNDALNKFNHFFGLEAKAGIALADTSRTMLARAAIAAAGGKLPRLSRRMDSLARASSGRPVHIPGDAVFPIEAFERDCPRQEEQGGKASQISEAALLPQVGFQSHHLGCSIRSAVAMNLLLGFLPTMIQSESSIDWRTGRSTFIGVSPLANAILVDKIINDDTLRYEPFAFVFPIWLEWQTLGYYNREIQHNGNGLSQLRVEIAPFSIPGKKDTDKFYPRKVRGFSGSADFFHGFPITKYTGIPAAVSCDVNYYDTPINRTLLDVFPFSRGNSDLFVSARVSAALAFPLMRNPGKTMGCYYDALYAKIGYRCSAVADRAFLLSVQEAGDRWPTILGHNFTTLPADSGLYVSHLFFVTAEATSISRYIFLGGMEISGIFDILREQVGLRISAFF